MTMPAFSAPNTPLLTPLIRRKASWYFGLVRRMYPAQTMMTTMPKSHHGRSTRRRPTASSWGLFFPARPAIELELSSAIGYLRGDGPGAAGGGALAPPP